jgi:hypothetical protein
MNQSGLLYIAAPMWLYGSRDYRLAMGMASAAGWRVFDVRSTYHGNQDWLARWPVEREQFDGLWLVAGPDGWIGRGTRIEHDDLVELGRPCWWWRPSGVIQTYRFGPTARSWRRWCQVLET